MKWYTIMALLIFYAVSTWFMLLLAGEEALLDIRDYLYWLVVTGSTVGYGDMSPETEGGKILVAVYVIPAGLSIFALVLGRVAGWVSLQWQKGSKGMHELNVSEHVLILGWNGKRTEQLLKLLLKEREDVIGEPEIVLCVRADITNPLPGEIEFVKVDSFNKDEDMDRACVADASTILIDNPEDDMTMTCALYCSKRNPSAHKVAYFDDESLVPLLQQHCPEIECTPSVAVEMLAKSAFDPGSSMLHHDLLDVYEGQAQFSAIIPNKIEEICAEALFYQLKKSYDATFIGFATGDVSHKISVNPSLKTKLYGKDKIFYIANKRINNIDWEKIQNLTDTEK
ncbi:potassium channel family protein [Glaciecola sp. 1036]|uniref:potassium channel family protein n=1 Tax=Alteromonadaceae TaxID=72275 RepID=UPI003CFE362B